MVVKTRETVSTGTCDTVVARFLPGLVIINLSIYVVVQYTVVPWIMQLEMFEQCKKGTIVIL